MRYSIRSVASGAAATLLLLAAAPPVAAGPECREALRAAEEQLAGARAADVRSTVEVCFGPGQPWTETVRAHTLRALASRALHDGPGFDADYAAALNLVRRTVGPPCAVPDQQCGYDREDFVLLVLSYFGLDPGTRDCQKQIVDAQRSLARGRWTQVIRQLEDHCFDPETLRSNKVQAHALGARALLGEDRADEAAESVRSLLCLNPGFRAAPDDRPAFVRLLEQQRVTVAEVPRTPAEVEAYVAGCERPPRRCPDADGDGFEACASCPGPRCDCDDGNPRIHPAALEICDGIDNDCAGSTADGSGERDRFGRACDGPDADRCRNGTFVCRAGNWICDEAPPGFEEDCTNQLDDDCDGLTDGADPDCAPPPCPDGDGDGFVDCEPPGRPCEKPASGRCDCDDTNPDCNRDCTDADRDGYCRPDDCDDANPRCNVDCTDGDRDGHCAPADCDDANAACHLDCSDADGDGVRRCDGDCDDDDARNHPGNIEVCDQQDNDCDGVCDEGCGPWELGVVGGFFRPDGDLSGKDEQFGDFEPQVGIRAGFLFRERLGWFADATFSDINTDIRPPGFPEPEDAETITVRSGVELLFGRHRRILPPADDPAGKLRARELEWRWFLTGGAGWVRYDLQRADDVDRALLSIGAGQRWQLDHRARLRWELRADHTVDSGGGSLLGGKELTSVQLLLGLTWTFGERCDGGPH